MTGRAEPDAGTWQRWLSNDHPDLAALPRELDAGHRPVAVHVGPAGVVAAQTRLRLSDESVRHLPGQGPDHLDAWAANHPQARLTTYWINGSLIDGYLVAHAAEVS
ncbi:MAG: hypothetical protein U0Q19_20455 [Kineosporiaceae bacterium]